MRIIAGQYRGRRLSSSRALELRPTSDRLRETLFNILAPRIEGSIFVDVFAGTGAIGIEALSRGAAQVFLIEQNAAAARLIESNLLELGVGGSAQVLRTDAGRGIRLLKQRGISADFCFVDPPYDTPSEYDRVLRILAQTCVMKAGGLVLLQHFRKQVLAEQIGGWRRVRAVSQGSNSLSFYQAAEDAASN